MPRPLGKLVVYDSHPGPLVARLIANGYAVLVAGDEAQLEALASRERPDLVIGNLGADGSTPVGVCRRLKTSLLLRHLPVVVLTHEGDLADCVAAVNGGADDYLVEPCEEEELLARINRAIVRARASLDANPLTCLPGNASIKAELNERMARGGPFGVLFVDLDNFKAFNDRYGFVRGDEALRVLGGILLEAIESPGNGHASDFAGNIGGDDFVVVTTADRAEAIAARICALVAQKMPYLYDEDDRVAGCISSTDRQGRRRTFALMTVTVAIVTNEHGEFTHDSEISQIGYELKRYLKELPGSRFLKNRRRRRATPPVPAPARLAPVGELRQAVPLSG